MGLPKDIINIVITMKSKDEKKRLNRNYHKKYEVYDCLINRYGILFCYRKKNKLYWINYRDLISKKYRKKIVCILTHKKRKYYVPKNY